MLQSTPSVVGRAPGELYFDGLTPMINRVCVFAKAADDNYVSEVTVDGKQKRDDVISCGLIKRVVGLCSFNFVFGKLSL